MQAQQSQSSTAKYGVVAPGYEPVAEEFERNFTERGEVGAAFAAVVDGKPVVDLWGGHAADGREWRDDTLQLIFSSTKGLVATALMVLVDRGALSIDAPVCAYWPEFASNGKEEVLVSDVLSHRARLPGISAPLVEGDLIDGERMAALLAEQAPERDPRAEGVYHPLTFGWLCGELVRRVTGRTVGRFFAEEIAEPLGLDVWIGLPAALESRVATLRYGASWRENYPPWTEDELENDRLLASVFANPPMFPGGRVFWNDHEFHAAEIPAINAIGTARSLARLFGCLAYGGEVEGVRIVTTQTLDRARRELSRFNDPLLDEPRAYGLGFQLQTALGELGPPNDAFGHIGAGGSVQAAWPRHRVGVSYVMNEMRSEQAGDSRARALLDCLFRVVDRRRRRKGTTDSGEDVGARQR